MAHARTHEAHGDARTAPSIDDASRGVANALDVIGPTRLGHGYGCPSEHAGPCTCGTAQLFAALSDLKAALEPTAKPVEPTPQA